MKNKLQLTMLVRRSNTKQTKSSKRKGDVDDKMHDSKEASGRGGDQHCRFKSCLYKTVYGEICDGHSNHDDVSLRVKLNDDAFDDGKAADACGHNNASTKHTLLLRDADDTEQKKRRKRGQQKFIIDLTDVPAQMVGVVLNTRESLSRNPRANGRHKSRLMGSHGTLALMLMKKMLLSTMLA